MRRDNLSFSGMYLTFYTESKLINIVIFFASSWRL